MIARLAASVLVSAIVRHVAADGGSAMILAKGDPTAGAILLALADRGRPIGLLERTLGPGGYALARTGPADADGPGAVDDYVARRRARDPDLWVVEMDSPQAEAIARAVLE